MSGDASDPTRLRPRPAKSSPAMSRPKRGRREGAPVANAPGWYVRRKPSLPVLFGHYLRRRPRFASLAAGTAAAIALGLVLVLSLVRADRSQVPADPPTASLVPRAPNSPGAGAGGPPTASAQAPAAGPTSKPDAQIQEPGDRQGTSGTAASPPKAAPAPPEEHAAVPNTSGEAVDTPTSEWQSRPRSRASMPSAARPQPSMGDTPFPPQVDRTVSPRPPRSSQAAAGPAPLGSAGEIRVFIHHVADRPGDAALAQQLADHLQRQGFTVADIRPVDFSIGKSSVRYFFPDDRDASERLVDELRSFLEGAAPDRSSDFTHFLPKPRPGNVEVWLPAS